MARISIDQQRDYRDARRKRMDIETDDKGGFSISLTTNMDGLGFWVAADQVADLMAWLSRHVTPTTEAQIPEGVR